MYLVFSLYICQLETKERAVTVATYVLQEDQGCSYIGSRVLAGIKDTFLQFLFGSPMMNVIVISTTLTMV